MRRLLGIAGIALAAGFLFPPPSAAQESGEDREPTGALVIGVPVAELRAFAGRRPVALGLGVYPLSRDARAFLQTLASGDRLEGGGVLGGAAEAGLSVAAGMAARVAGTPVADVVAAFAEPGTVSAALDADISLIAVRLADDVDALLRLDDRPAFVIASDGRTPLLVGTLRGRSPGLLADGVARRTGIVTPADLRRSILDAAGVVSDGPGRVLTLEPHPAPLEHLSSLAARLEDEVDVPGRLTVTACVAGLIAVVLGTAALVLRRRRLAGALAGAAAAVPAGYVGGLFLTGVAWPVRAGVVVGAAIVGIVLSFAGARRSTGWVLLLTALGVSVITMVAASAPDGATALALWGNPLDSWRFFGLRNHLAMFAAGGFLAGATLLAMPVWLLAAGALAVGVVVGAPALGANFIAVLIIGFGATLIVLARAGGRPRFLHLPYAGVAGVLSMAIALLADAGSPVTHGGRAVGDIRSDGIGAAWDIVTRRARLNYDEIVSLGIPGIIGFVLAAFALALLFWWALRDEAGDPIVRAGVGGLAGAALLTLVVEDSGFFAGAILGLFPWIAFTIEQARLLEQPARAVLAQPATEGGGAPAGAGP